MTENQNVGGEPAKGAEGQPVQPVSPQSPASIDGDVTKLFSALEGKFSEQFNALSKELRGLQSRQDKSDNAFQQQLARFNQIKTQNGYSDEQAIEAMQRQDSDAQWRQSLESKLDDLVGRIAGAGTQASGQQKVADVFASLSLDTKDPRVAPFLLREYKSEVEMKLAAYELRDQLAKSPNPSPAQEASLQSQGSGEKSTAELVAESESLQDNPSKNYERIIAIHDELKKRGVI